MIRVLQIGMTDNWGGIESYLMNYYRNIDKTKVQFDFVNIYNNDLCFQNEIVNMGGTVYKVPNYYKHPFKYLKEVSKLIKEKQYDTIHCNMNSAVMLHPLIAAKLGGAKLIISHSHNSSSDKGIVKTILHNINKHFIPIFANMYLACSEMAGEWFYSKKIRSKNTYQIVNNGIEVNNYKFNKAIRKKKREELGIFEDEVVIGHVGRFNKQKNHDFIIDIFNNYKKTNKKSKLLLIGIGPLKSNIENKVRELSLENDVLFLGQRKDVNELMQAMDYFILPSLYEGLPLVGVEAQASGLNCLFSDTITRELKINDNVKFCKIKNINEWTFEENVNNERYSIEKSKFDIKKCVKDLYSVYERVERIKNEK